MVRADSIRELIQQLQRAKTIDEQLDLARQIRQATAEWEIPREDELQAPEQLSTGAAVKDSGNPKNGGA